MQALVISPGSHAGIHYRCDYPEPHPTPGDVLIRVHLAGICATDLELARGYMNFTGVPGHEFVGTVVHGLDELRGQRVVAEINCGCGSCDACLHGLGNHCAQRTVVGIAGRDGACAEYVSVPARNCHPLPDTITDQQAVLIEPLAAAAHVLDACHLDAATRVVVLGTGRLGLLVAQLPALRASRLTVVGRSRASLELCRRLGIDATPLDQIVPAPEYEVVIDCTGSLDGLKLAIELCRPRGALVLKSTYAGTAPVDLSPLVVNEIELAGNRCGPFPEAIRLLENRAVRVDELITGVFPLSRGVEAFVAARSPEHVKILLNPDAA